GNPDASTLQIVSGPSHGTAVDPPNTITYTPNKGYTGPDSLTYRVCSTDNPLLCTQAVLSFNVVAGIPNTGFGNAKTNQHKVPYELLAVTSFGFAMASALFVYSKKSY
ncbi:MAG: Ig-like domain-containing protein, partial [Candidatus Saccharibacteria bacterium]